MLMFTILTIFDYFEPIFLDFSETRRGSPVDDRPSTKKKEKK